MKFVADIEPGSTEPDVDCIDEFRCTGESSGEWAMPMLTELSKPRVGLAFELSIFGLAP